MPELTISESLYRKLEDQTEGSMEDTLWELMYQSYRDLEH